MTAPQCLTLREAGARLAVSVKTTAPAKRSDSRSRRWAGGTCQLEALPPDLLARVVEDAIRSNLDLDRYEDALGREREDRAELLALPPGGAP